MGFKFSQDGLCIVCKKHTTKFCDSCGRYICDEHTIEIPVKGSTKAYMFCRECYEKGRKPLNAGFRNQNPHYEGN